MRNNGTRVVSIDHCGYSTSFRALTNTYSTMYTTITTNRDYRSSYILVTIQFVKGNFSQCYDMHCESTAINTYTNIVYIILLGYWGYNLSLSLGV